MALTTAGTTTRLRQTTGGLSSRALTAVPAFPVWDLAGLLGSVAWGLWVAALGVTMPGRRRHDA
ncbi:hypothetical protein QRX50_00200 [Amycolatopsis carbonis]|uniref:Uncharacterized protein n=1 Tax=Amycolatopsis carbonis TaxID=715471 RepID=A0A9Y2IHJ5_9PSEU|nr:hypothetical protein [Amycolatopsis sp. 2-15]WIX79275.1 hypothetical protein QRX50_00200 [Amycolatopsis sp. 2-15]